MVTRIAMVVGEASGDLLASHLIRALKARRPDLVFFGVGGPRMAAEGFEALFDYEILAVNGFVDVLKRYRELAAFRRKLTARIRRERPAAFIGVDAPEFNLWIERQLKRAGMPALHFVSPSIWAWRGGRIKGIRRSVSHMLCLFPFEAPLYEQAGIPHTYVGHPLADEIPLQSDRARARQLLGLGGPAPVFALLPGSRQSEVRNLAETYVRTAFELAKRLPGARFLVPLATRETRELFQTALARVTTEFRDQLPPRQDEEVSEGLPDIRLLFGHSLDAMTAADVVLVASGTATLEAALLKRPMVITYRIGTWSYRLMRRLTYLPWVGLPNILCNEGIVPEILQDEATPLALADALQAWLDDEDRRLALEIRFGRLHRILRQDMADKAAQAVIGYLGEAPALQPGSPLSQQPA